MLRTLKSEIWKAFHNYYFVASLICGLGIIMIDVFENIVLVNEFSRTPSMGGGFSGFSLFARWISINNHTYGCSLFYFVWPILAALPYGWSFFNDYKIGYINQCVSRSSTRIYFATKYLATFVSGGVAVAVPVLINLLLNALVCPYCVPLVTSKITGIFDGWFLSELFYTRPWLFAFAWCCVEFLLGGATACLCFAIGTKLRYRFLIIIMPFVTYFLIDVAYSMIGKLRYWEHMWSPLQLARAACFNANPEWLLCIIIGALLLISSTLGYRQVVKNELV